MKEKKNRERKMHPAADEVLSVMKGHRSIRKYKKNTVNDRLIDRICEAAQQAAFASQTYSVIVSKKGPLPFGAPVLLTFCVDIHKFELIMKKRGWKWVTNDVFSLLLGLEDACYFAQNFALAAEAHGLGTCFLGYAPYAASAIRKKYGIPKRVFPFVQMTLGFPDEDPPVRPRYPREFVLFREQYKIKDESIAKAMKKMDEGYLRQDYYKKLNAKIPLIKGKKENFTYKGYSWTEHICRKWGQWNPEDGRIKKQFREAGFDI